MTRYGDYRDHLRRKYQEPLPSPQTEKRPGDWVLTGSGFVRALPADAGRSAGPSDPSPCGSRPEAAAANAKDAA